MIRFRFDVQTQLINVRLVFLYRWRTSANWVSLSLKDRQFVLVNLLILLSKDSQLQKYCYLHSVVVFFCFVVLLFCCSVVIPICFRSLKIQQEFRKLGLRDYGIGLPLTVRMELRVRVRDIREVWDVRDVRAVRAVREVRDGTYRTNGTYGM